MSTDLSDEATPLLVAGKPQRHPRPKKNKSDVDALSTKFVDQPPPYQDCPKKLDDEDDNEKKVSIVIGHPIVARTRRSGGTSTKLIVAATLALVAVLLTCCVCITVFVLAANDKTGDVSVSTTAAVPTTSTTARTPTGRPTSMRTYMSTMRLQTTRRSMTTMRLKTTTTRKPTTRPISCLQFVWGQCMRFRFPLIFGYRCAHGYNCGCGFCMYSSRIEQRVVGVFTPACPPAYDQQNDGYCYRI